MDTKLHEAVRYCDIEGVLDALQNKYDPNVVGLLKWTPVQEAARAGERDILFHLLAHGGNPNLQESLSSKNTALHYAAGEGHIECLRLLLQHGGNTNLLNADGQTCQQAAAPQFKDEVAKLISDWDKKQNKMKNGSQKNNGDETIHQQNQMQPDKWSTLPKVPKRAEMGYMHLSFEYHKRMLKVRVWQISDLLVPPPQTSMIHSVFVRAYFIPDAGRKSHRRTEDIILDIPDPGGDETPKTGIQHIFTPSSFKFKTPLLYNGVTEDMVKERSLQLEVCMTQKRSHRVFLMAMVHMPLRTAVRRPIREKYPLIPCMNITIPNNMRVYSASQLQFESSKGDLSPALQRAVSSVKEIPLTARDIELEDVVSLSGEEFLNSHLSLCMSEDSDSEGLERVTVHRQRDVRICDNISSGGSSTATVNIHSSIEGVDSGDDSVPEVVTHTELSDTSTSTFVDMKWAGDDRQIASCRRKIIPTEIQGNRSVDVAITMPSEETVLDMGKVDLESSKKSASIARSVLSDSNTTYERNIHPRVHSAHTLSIHNYQKADIRKGILDLRGAKENDEGQTRNRQGNNTSNTNSAKKMPVRKKKIMVLPGEIRIPSTKMDTSSDSLPNWSSDSSTDSDGVSLHDSQDPDFTSTSKDLVISPASRPETPCWDFYDFSEDMPPDEEMQAGSQVLEGSLSQIREKKDDHSCFLSKEPILPMALTDDFDTLTVDAEQTGNGNSEQTL